MSTRHEPGRVQWAGSTWVFRWVFEAMEEVERDATGEAGSGPGKSLRGKRVNVCDDRNRYGAIPFVVGVVGQVVVARECCLLWLSMPSSSMSTAGGCGRCLGRTMRSRVCVV